MFNILPGTGLGFTASKEIGLGLMPLAVSEVIVPIREKRGGSSTRFRPLFTTFDVEDNAYSTRADDNEIVLLLNCITSVIE